VNETAHVLDLVGFVVGVLAVMGIILLAAHLWSPSRKLRGGVAGQPDAAPRDSAPSGDARSGTPAPSTSPPAGASPPVGTSPEPPGPQEPSRSETTASRTEDAPQLAHMSNGSALAVAANGTEGLATPATSNGNHNGNGKYPMTNGVDRTAGWRPDPGQGEGLLRYWDGLRWTDHFARRVRS
jgi:Protein of unknown function (DUF2510)